MKGWWLAAAALLCASLAACARAEWRCPELDARPAAECSCDMPRTLRCAGDHAALQIIGRHLRAQAAKSGGGTVGLLDCALRGVSALTASAVSSLRGLRLHGLVLSSGDIRRVQQAAFESLADTLLALGLPNNQLPSVPTESLTNLPFLDRLDLSYNKIHTLEDDSFRGIMNLTYLDLSENQITDISSDALRPLTKLTILRLRGNLLKVSSLGALKVAKMLRELDLSSNALTGPLGPNTVPPLRALVSLQLADNTFASIRRGCLAGLMNLTHLGLHNNQIDVLEDHAFRQLSNLTHLDLSHNEIVAVSGSSLAHLNRLLRLDLSHNFLRSLSAEPLKTLDRLSDLLLHDNDISMIDDGALSEHKNLRRFTIEDNPLNCDCLMAGFARWLREAKNLSQSDQAAAVCATPPHLEGALLARISKSKLCEDSEPIDPDKAHDEAPKAYNDDLSQKDSIDVTAEEYNPLQTNSKYFDERKYINNTFHDEDAINYVEPPSAENDDYESDGLMEEDLPTSKAKVTLEAVWMDHTAIRQLWSVQGGPKQARYRCAGATVASPSGDLRHASCQRAPPNEVAITGISIDPSVVYTFCIALEELDAVDVPVALVLGCAPPRTVLPMTTTPSPASVAVPARVAVTSRQQSLLRVSEVRSNVTSEGVLSVIVSLLGFPPMQPPNLHSRTQRLSEAEARYFSTLHNCYIVIEVLSRGSLVAQRDTPCQSSLEVAMDGFIRGPYEICATLSRYQLDQTKSICVVPQVFDNASEVKAGFKSLNSVLVSVSIGLMIMVAGLIWFTKRMLVKPVVVESHRCFRQEPPPEENQRASYVMLTATSKV